MLHRTLANKMAHHGAEGVTHNANKMIFAYGHSPVKLNILTPNRYSARNLLYLSNFAHHIDVRICLLFCLVLVCFTNSLRTQKTNPFLTKISSTRL